MLSDNVHTAYCAVEDFETFLAFAEVFGTDFENASIAQHKKPAPPYGPMYGWENTDIGHFLESAVAGSRDNGIGKDLGGANERELWKVAARFLLLGATYE